tara:strand:+ start:29200 stop:30486 length:1287 start_codon:yes stop_codon:yes gene_type:complete
MSREYVARDPRTGRRISQKRTKKQIDIRSMLPSPGIWQRIPFHQIVILASGKVELIEIPRAEGGGLAKRTDGIRALNRVLSHDIEDGHKALCEALDDDDEKIRIAALEALPSFAIKKHKDLFVYLSDRLLEESDNVRRAARVALQKSAPIFPSGCEHILRRELRDNNKQHRDDAFIALKETSVNWVETGCLHIDELIREEDVDLRRRGSKILRSITTKGGATGWDLISWSLQDEDAQVRRNASACLPSLANSEPRVAAILVEASIIDEDNVVRKNIIRTLKSLDMDNPRVVDMILDGARDRDYALRKACIEQLSIILSGDRLREVSTELLRQETKPDLRKKLERLSRDVDWEGTEDEKNRSLAPLEKVSDDITSELNGLTIEKPENKHFKPQDDPVTPRSGESISISEGHKEESIRRAARKEDERGSR